MNARFAFFGALAAAAVLAACGGGGGGGGGCCPATAPPSTSPPVTPTPTVTQSVTFGGSASSANLPSNPLGITGTVSLPGGSGNATITYSETAPSPGPATIAALHRTPTSSSRVRRASTASSNTGVIYLTVTASGAVTMNGVPGFAVTLPASVAAQAPTGSQFFVAFYNSQVAGNPVWQSSSSTGVTLVNNALTIPATTTPSFTLSSGQSLYLVVYFGYFIPQVNYNGCVGVQGDSVTRNAQPQLVGVNPPTVGSSWSYTGTLTGAIYESTPCPIPTATQNATVSINVNVTSPPAGAASGFVDEHSVEKDAFTTNTTQVTTDAIVNGTNETSETSTDLSGNTTVTTWPGNGLTYYNAANGFSNGPPASVNSTFVDGTTEQRTYTDTTSGAYTETDSLLANGAGGTSTITVSATGAATYTIAGQDPNTGASSPIALTMSAPTGGNIDLTVTLAGSTVQGALAAWYQTPLYSDATTFSANAPISSQCQGSALGGTTANEYIRTISHVDPALGSTETETIDSWVVPNYPGTSKTVGPVCVVISDTQNLYYDFLQNVTSGIYFSNNASPLQTNTYNEVYYFRSAPAGESRVRAESIAGAAMAFAVQHSGIAFARAVEREQRLQRFVRAAASGRIQGGVR